MARDPFSWADQFSQTQSQRAAQEANDAQNGLMRMFVTEAARQAPFSSLPTDLALQNNQAANSFRNAVSLAGVKAQLKPAVAPAKIGNMITAAARTYGIDPDVMMTLADIESKFDPNAVSSTGAKGIFQVTGGYAQDNGIANPFDPLDNINGTMRGTRKAIDQLQSVGIKPTAGNIYLVHQQGLGGAMALLRNPNADAVEALTQAYGGDRRKAQQAFMVNGGRPGMTAGMFAQMWTSKADRIYQSRVALRGRDSGPKSLDDYITVDGYGTITPPGLDELDPETDDGV